MGLRLPPTSQSRSLNSCQHGNRVMYEPCSWLFVCPQDNENCEIVEECGGTRNRRLVAFEHFTTQTANARGYWRWPSRDYIVYPCWKTIKDASECTFMSFLHLVWSITQPEWLGRLEMHNNSFHDFHINNAHLNKMSCKKSHVFFYGTFLPLCSTGEQFCVESTCWRKFIKTLWRPYLELWKTLSYPTTLFILCGCQLPYEWKDKLLGPCECYGKRREMQAANFLLSKQEVPLDERVTHTHKLQLH